MTDSSRTDSGHTYGPSEPGLLQRLKTLWGPLGSDSSSVREAIEELIEEQPETGDAIDDHERILLANVLKQRNATVEQIMVPRADIVSSNAEMSVLDTIKLLVEEGHSRVPVYRDNLDEVIGMVHIKDLASVMVDPSSNEDSSTLTTAMRAVIFVAPSARVLDLLLEMRLKRTHMAMVVDEYGGIDGLVTIEDLVEQIVGEIADEHDEDEELDLINRGDGTVIVDARATLSEFNERYGRLFETEECDEIDTLGGLVFKLAGRVPSRGELVGHPSGVEFEILDADHRRIRRLRMLNIPSVNCKS